MQSFFGPLDLGFANGNLFVGAATGINVYSASGGLLTQSLIPATEREIGERFAIVPEPSSAVLFGIGVAAVALGVVNRRQREPA